MKPAPPGDARPRGTGLRPRRRERHRGPRRHARCSWRSGSRPVAGSGRRDEGRGAWSTRSGWTPSTTSPGRARSPRKARGALRVYRQRHPWVSPRPVAGVGRARDVRAGDDLGEFIASSSGPGSCCATSTDAYRALRSFDRADVGARTEEARRHRRVARRGRAAHRLQPRSMNGRPWPTRDDPLTEVRTPTEGRALSANPRALRVMVRQSMFRRVSTFVARYAALAALGAGSRMPRGRLRGLPRRLQQARHRPAGSGGRPCCGSTWSPGVAGPADPR